MAEYYLRAMKVALVARMLRKHKLEGIGVFTHELFKRICSENKPVAFDFLFDRPYEDEFIYSSNINPVILSPAARHPLLLAYWYQHALPAYLKKSKPDVLISGDGAIPLNCKTPTVSVIHDINFEHYPADLPFAVRTYYKYYYSRIANAASHIVTVSDYSKQDIAACYKIPESKISVVSNGVNPEYSAISESQKEAARIKFAGGKKYILFIGSIHKRKNVASMVRAFSLFKSKSQSNIQFVVAGAKRWWSSDLEDAVNESTFQMEIHFPGRIEQRDMPGLMASAEALFYVSKFEGFGIPIIEAMRCGVPVLTSTTTSMPEIAGGAAMLADPDQVQAMADKLMDIISDASMRERLITDGLIRSRQFDWNKSAKKMWEIILSVAKKK